MKYITLVVAVLTIAGCATIEPQATDSVACFETGERESMLALDPKSFDQTKGQGWRLIAERECYTEAAQLIAEYRMHAEDPGIARHHQAQMHAGAEERDEAIGLLDELITEAEADEEWSNLYYRRATRAFLSDDLKKLEAARADLAAIPLPSGFADAIERFAKEHPGFPAPNWPPNLDVVDAFIACFGRSYNEAYGGKACREAGELSAYGN